MLSWHADWAWSLPLIVANVVIHVVGLGMINERFVEVVVGGVPPQCRAEPRTVGLLPDDIELGKDIQPVGDE